MFYLSISEPLLNSIDYILKLQSKFSGMSTAGRLALNIDEDFYFKLAMERVFYRFPFGFHATYI